MLTSPGININVQIELAVVFYEFQITDGALLPHCNLMFHLGRQMTVADFSTAQVEVDAV